MIPAVKDLPGRFEVLCDKLAKHCCRAYATNDVQEEDEPKEDQRLCISVEEFLTLLRRTFPGDRPADIRAILKRSVVFVFGLSALYLRLPSQQDDAPIHRIQIQNLRKDVLADSDKVFYGKFKGGSIEKPPGFEEATEKEQSVIRQSMEVYGSFGKAEEYVSHANGEIEDLLLHSDPKPSTHGHYLHRISLIQMRGSLFIGRKIISRLLFFNLRGCWRHVCR